MANRRSENVATVMLLIGVFFWGATFVLVKVAVARVDVYSYLSVRFLISTALLAVVFRRSLKNMTREVVWKGVLIGAALSASFMLQTIGLQYTTASNSAFITGLYVVVVPLSMVVLDRRLPSALQSLAVGMALLGLVFITVKPGFKVSAGDVWTLLCAVAFGVHVVMIGRMIKTLDARPFTIVQLFTVAVITGAMGIAANGRIVISDSYIVWGSILFCAVFAGAFMYTVQAHYQRRLSEIKAVVIYSFEPMFGALIAFFALKDNLTLKTMSGGALIVAAMIFSDLKINVKAKDKGKRKNNKR